ncbi:hypothetical protein [Streptomyces sp. NPDC085540]|uniref:hypothetical protein n=1 Tax=Streptomyces sp. NPDC085540 TaxID=3365730 RepID=UPI0037D6A64F
MSDASPSAPIALVLPDGQAIERVRLYERQQLDTGLWMYRIGVPLWQTAAGGGVEPAEYSTWVTAAQLRPLPGVDLGRVPAHPRTRTSAPARWAWLLGTTDAMDPSDLTLCHRYCWSAGWITYAAV